MALPSSSKPNWWVDDVDDFGPTTSNVNREFSVEKAFFEMMAEWYKSLSPQRKRSLVKREILEKAKSLCQLIHIAYFGLPRTWLRTLNDVYQVTFKHVPKTEKYKMKAHKLLCRAVVLDKLTSAEMKKKLSEMRKGAIDPQCLMNELRALIRTSKKAVQQDDAPIMEDLSNEPPPGWWMEAYAQGQNVKRTLHTALTKDKKTLVVYYHYAKVEDGKQYFTELFPSGYRYVKEQIASMAKSKTPKQIRRIMEGVRSVPA